jgi:oligoendopeptidase F
LFDRLDEDLSAVTTAAGLAAWLLAWGELSAALDEESARRYVAMTCQTDDLEAERAYLHFVEQIEPRTKPRQFDLERRYLAHPAYPGLDPARYAVFNRHTRSRVELFREENVALEMEETCLGQHYQKLSGLLTVTFRGEEQTLVQMGRYLEEPDRSLRQEAWERVAARRVEEADTFEGLFDRLTSRRESIARCAGCANYREYAWRRLERFDYTPADCERFHGTIEEEILPLVRRLQAERRRQLSLDRLRPWDLAVDPLNRPPLRPFQQVEQLLDQVHRLLAHLDPELARQFGWLEDRGLLDLANRKGKAPGGYLQPLAESRLAFIFMNAVGIQRDVETLLHEAGHAFHALATQAEDLYAYRSAPIEFCEMASMSMELLGGEHLERVYPPTEAARAKRGHLEGILNFFPWMATVDAFQHWLYTRAGHTRAQRTQAWLELMDRFGGEVDWSGHEAARAHLWHRQLHIFLNPFYYVEYGIAQLGALQVWANARSDPHGALRQYREALALGGSQALPALFAAAGCRFDFGPETLRPLVALIDRELAALA